ncbi:MAG: hypothetical protein EP347_10810 [Alphaproteobacteria bacterium]|nr:MAG: hypothetical protein EP347_10810 [Alphaproteobacteria bacterium]
MTLPRLNKLQVPYRARLLGQLTEAIAAMPEGEAAVLVALMKLTLARAEAAGRQDPFATPLPVTVGDLKEYLPFMPAARLRALLEKLRLEPAVLRRQGSSLVTSDDAGIPILDIIRTQIYGNRLVRAAWWVRMGLWSHWQLNDLERSFIARSIVALYSASTEEVASSAKLILAKMAESQTAFQMPLVVQPVLRDMVIKHSDIQADPRVWLEAIHLLEQAELIICPADRLSVQHFEDLLDVRTHSNSNLPLEAPTRH